MGAEDLAREVAEVLGGVHALQGPLGVVERPYDPPLGPGVVARVQMARSAVAWRSDTEALLTEQGLSTELAPTIEALVDTHGMSIRTAVEMIRQVFAAYPE